MMVEFVRRIIPRGIIPLFMLLLVVIPFLTIYGRAAANLSALPIFDAPGWFIPVGFICIVLIFILALSMKGEED
ncbi:hypothetical protein [Oceanobacillus sp. CFH 90083]|uniref:hypothetical protein n=1 Tax=Oceanobacillus sp. CFH 90083 TaxID=2592336 RepID=UPI00128C5C46|nr:hypothetical protein [Oceanobacillus sp. CFH 90083]